MRNKIWNRLYVGMIVLVLTFCVSLTTLASESPTSIIKEHNNSLQELLKLHDGYLFTGLMDITFGSNQLAGSIEPLVASDTYQEDIYIDGRLAFYLKGKIKGDVLLTAWMDTGEESLANILKNLSKRDTQTLFEKLNPSKYYPVYGDNSTVEDSIESQGKLYIKVEAEDYQIIWGNYYAGFKGNELSIYNRTLYGLKAKKSKTLNSKVYTVKGFLSIPGSLHSRDELLSTGGMLYYLKHGDLVTGSESLKVEIRESLLGRVLKEYQLIPAIDYELDYIQGRVILKKDILELAESEQIIIDDNKEEQEIYLIAEYDYEPASSLGDDTNIGLKMEYDITEKLKVSQTFFQESATGGDLYDLYGFNIEYVQPEGFNLNLEWAETGNVLSGKHISDDGGISYQQLKLNNNINGGQAYKISSGINLNKIYHKLPEAALTAHYYHWDKGFTNYNKTITEDRDELDLNLKGYFNQVLSYFGRYTDGEEKATSTLGIKGKYAYSEKINLTGEIKGKETVQKDAAQPGVISPGNTVQQLKGALKVEYQLAEGKRIYGSQQLTLYSSDETADNRTTIGTVMNITKKLNLDLEGSTGNAGDNLKLGGEYNYGAGKLYTSANLTSNNSSNKLSTTYGSSGKLNENTTVYSERKMDTEKSEDSTSDVFGVKYTPDNKWGMTLDYTRSDVNKNDGEKIKRQIVTPGIIFKGETISSNLKLQYRNDQGKEELQQLILTSGLNYQLSNELSVLTDLDYALTREDDSDLAKDSKASIGLAYRPVDVDHINLLGKYTYLANSAPEEQENVAEYEESSQVLSLEGIFELDKRWQLAGKVAFKKAEISLGGSHSPDKASTYDSDTYLWINRLNYKLNQDWDFYGEYRILRNIQARDQKDGFLLGVNKDLGNNIKLGLGYNFTDFNDDLTDLNYSARGLFVNLVRKW